MYEHAKWFGFYLAKEYWVCLSCSSSHNLMIDVSDSIMMSHFYKFLGIDNVSVVYNMLCKSIETFTFANLRL